jgi:RimJ/RimL family protein N-acetyltransferase
MLIGEKVKLVPLDSKNIPIFLKWINDIEITQFLLINRPTTREEEEAWFATIKEKKDTYYFSIIVKNEETLIGNCSFDVDWKNRVGNVGILIGEKEYHNQGYGTEALNLVNKFAFEELNMNRMELTVHAFNVRAQQCYKKVGFKEEGRRRQAIFAHGKHHDSILMSILQEEWKERNEKEK